MEVDYQSFAVSLGRIAVGDELIIITAAVYG